MSAADAAPVSGERTPDPQQPSGLEAAVQELKVSEAERQEAELFAGEKGEQNTEQSHTEAEHGLQDSVTAPGGGEAPVSPAVQEPVEEEAAPKTPTESQPIPPDVYDNIEALGGSSHLQPDSQSTYHDPTPKTPQPLSPAIRPQGQAPQIDAGISESLIDTTEDLQANSGKEKERATEDGADDDSRSEIQSIMEQFEGQEEDETAAAAGSPIASPSSAQHPPRQSSLGLVDLPSVDLVASPGGGMRPTDTVASPTKPGSIRSISFSQQQQSLLSPTDPSKLHSPLTSPALNKALPPEPDPEPDLPFDFHRFLDQLKHRSADPVARFLRSFLTEFGKKQWMVHEQVKIISDFLAFITNRMAQCEVWRNVSDAEFDNAREGMEKLVMNRLYSQTFSPAIPAPAPPSPRKGKSSRQHQRPQPAPGRRGQHQEDVERDDILAQKVRIYGWVRERHLDIKPVGRSGQRFLTLAQQELLKIRSYRAPRDKVICVLNCCKVIFGLLRNSKDADTSADSFVPLLIYVILQANPEHLVSNVQYIFRFRNQDKLGGESGYYLSSLMGAIQFIENLDRTSLTVDDAEFEASVEAAVSAIAEREKPTSPVELAASEAMPALSEKQGPSDPEKADHTPRASLDQRPLPTRPDAQYSETPGQSSAAGSAAQALEAPVAGLLKTIQKPLNSIGRMFSEELGPEQAQQNSPSQNRIRHQGTPSTENARQLSPSLFQTPPPAQSRRDADGGAGRDESLAPGARRAAVAAANPALREQMRAEDAAARQASAEAAEAQRIQRAEHRDVVDTLAGMFPNLDRDVIDDVVRMKEGRVGSAVDACLALNA